ncbi:transporter substrate-binding domain-containing protein [Pseudomonas purpurea]|uniref:transporter substrate-binding domain-containing protein n=1 Tax=Pseudomonas purpurea TaxID=3136737 RepID=UPI0032674ED3
MRYFRGIKTVLSAMVLTSALGVGQWGLAAQLASHGAGTSMPVEPLKLDAGERQWIAEHPRIVVASQQFPLYLFKDEQGRWSGLNQDILERIARMTGLQFVHEESFSTAQLLGLLESGKADMSTTLAASEERKAFLDFSHAFGGSGWVFVVRESAPTLHSMDQLAGKVLALPARHALEAGIRRDHPHIQLRTVQTYAEARALVESGEADATVENESGARVYPAGQLKVGPSIDGMWEPDHLALSKHSPLLLSILNKALEAFPPTEMRAIRSKWLAGLTVNQAPSLWQRLSEWACWGVFIASVFALISLLWNRRLKAQVTQRVEVQRRLDDELSFQRTLMDALPDPMFVRDMSGRLMLCNKRYEELFSTRFDQIQGTLLTEAGIFPDATAELLQAELMDQLSTRRNRFLDRQLTFNNGPRQVYQWTVPFYAANGQLRGVLGGWIDTGARQRDGAQRDLSAGTGAAQF